MRYTVQAEIAEAEKNLRHVEAAIAEGMKSADQLRKDIASKTQFATMLREYMDPSPVEPLVVTAVHRPSQKTGPKVTQRAATANASKFKLLSTDEVIEKVTVFLESHQPKTSSEILTHLNQSKFDIRGLDKLTYLAGILSRSDLFAARRKLGGWFLAKDDPKKGEALTIDRGKGLIVQPSPPAKGINRSKSNGTRILNQGITTH